jgi:hypothetical protein
MVSSAIRPLLGIPIRIDSRDSTDLRYPTGDGDGKKKWSGKLDDQ